MSEINYGPAINIGPSKQAIEAASAAILAIVSTPHLDQKTIRCALEALSASISVGSSSVSNCNFNIGPSALGDNDGTPQI